MTNSNSVYSICFRNLPDGIHTFNFEVSDNFFSQYEHSEVKQGNIKINVILQKSPQLLSFKFKLNGFVNVQCDRCSDIFDLKIKNKVNLYVKFGEENSDITDVDDTLTLSYSEDEIDLSQHIYEYIHLSIPYRRLHPRAGNGKRSCNREMLRKIKEYSTHSTESESDIDPRWEKLKSLYN